MTLKGLGIPIGAVNLTFPLKSGIYCIVQGGDDLTLNHHYSVPAQRYALDIVKLNKLGWRAKNLSPRELADYHIFNSTVYSPCAGTIIKAVGSFNDLSPGVMDPDHPAGNYIAIKKNSSNEIVILAHLKKDSLLISSGDTVTVGQPIAKVGNSGNTTEPHLHIHCVKNSPDDFLFTGEGVAMLFKNKFLVRNDLILQKK